MSQHTNKVALITGAAKRIGAQLALHLHQNNYDVVIHYHHSEESAFKLTENLNTKRPNSCICCKGDLSTAATWQHLAEVTLQWHDRLDLLINNASTFYPTPLDQANLEQWQDLFASNTQAPYFLIQALRPLLQTSQGNVINMIDAMVDHCPTGFSLYTMAKAALKAQTKSLAKELAPYIRVNAIAPGAILWPEHVGDMNAAEQQKVLDNIPLKRQGKTEDITQAMWFLAEQAPYITGQILAVDGGRSL